MNEQRPVALSGNLTRDAWLALANAAQALQNLARAALGENLFAPVPVALTHSPATDPRASVSVAEGINGLLVSKARVERSDRYLRALKNSLSKFARGRQRQPMDAVTTEQIEIWLAESDWAPRTKAGYLSDVSILYNFARKRGWCSTNPAAAVELPTDTDKIIGVHTPDQARAVLTIARKTDPNIARCMALRYFAGMRAIEAESQAEEDIRPDDGIVVVTRAKRRTRAHRPVTILPVLGAWLGVGGSLPLHDVSNRMSDFMDKVRAEGIPWPHNAPRHSFCSYHLAMFENAGKTALEAGHSEQMLFQHYRALVTKREAEKFWSIFP